ncbi:hypothetical protein BDV25DRAFT_14939 [Aspergillus avenaceus]|uniref:Uncharacterized protein n=1 Tax=Aspergillus avenaceus TaxID=36643 RepID=A0A5N6U5X0_ASPAV|nr:hypothetical protein BDV25DRAFT_14939 [Aspergillus avenaceus]
MKHYPESKVILPTRDVDGWHASCLLTVYQRSKDPVLQLLSLIDTPSRRYYTLLQKLQDLLYRGDFAKYGKEVFNDHNADLRQRVPAERLLEYRVEHGWEPLCEFLEMDIPDSEFPRSNDQGSFWKGCRARDIRIAKEKVTMAIPVGCFVLASVVYRLASRWRVE